MSSDQAETFSTEAVPKKKGGGCLKGCLIAFVVFVILASVAAWYVASQAKGWAISLVSFGVEQMLDETGLPEEEQAEVMVEVQRVADGFKNNQLTLEDAAGLLESPVLNMFLLQTIENIYLDPSGLSDEEKAAGSLTLRRFTRGFIEGQIDPGAIDGLMQHVADRDQDGDWQIRQNISDEDLRAFLAEASAKADEAGIPAEVEPIDPSDELKKVVDDLLGEGP